MFEKTRKIFRLSVHESQHIHPVTLFFIKYRYLFFLLFTLGIWIDANVYTGRSLVSIYSLIMLLLGAVYSNVWQAIINSLLVTILRYASSPNGFPADIEILLFQWISYFAIWFAVSSLIKQNIQQRENLIGITAALANTLDSRDKYTADHSTNVSRYSELIAKEMGLPKKMCDDIKLGAQLHDVGKIGIPENILNKPGRLTEEEFEIIKTHPLIGFNMIKHISTFNKNGVLDAILYHHEREDGSGYPKGLKKEQIPLVAKIVAVSDSFDAMTSNRVYRNRYSFEHAVNQIILNKGTHYDPIVVEAFYRVIEREGENILQIKDEQKETNNIHPEYNR